MKKIFLAILLLFLPFTTALGVKMSNLYQAEVPVAAQTYDLREQAVKDGLLQVLIKISGNKEIYKNPVIKAGLKKADYFVQDYSYSSDSRDSSQYQLRISYEPKDVNRLIANARVAFWSDNRPLTLVWLVITDKQNITTIIGNEMADTIFNKMMQESKNNGIPLIFPMMDVDEISKISEKDIGSMNISLLQNAAKRYSPDALLIGKIEEGHRGSRSQWQLIMKDKHWNFKVENNNTDQVIAYVMTQVSQILSGRDEANAIKNSGPAIWVKLEINHIAKRKDFAQLVQFLKQIVNVQNIDLIEINGDKVKLAVQIEGTLITFEQNILANQHLVLKSEDGINTKLIYEWIN